jgi:hypothetical protein
MKKLIKLRLALTLLFAGPLLVIGFNNCSKGFDSALVAHTSSQIPAGDGTPQPEPQPGAEQPLPSELPTIPLPEIPPSPPSPSTGSYGTPEKPFAANSPWNTPIPGSAQYLPNDSRSSTIRNIGGSTLQVHSYDYTVPVWYASTSDPNVKFDIRPPSGGTGSVTIKVPSSAVASPGTDMHLITGSGIILQMLIELFIATKTVKN